MVEIIIEPLAEKRLRVKRRVGLLIERHIDKAAGLLKVTSAGAHSLRQKGRQLIGLYLLHAAADRELIAILCLIIDHTAMNLRHLNQEITD